ncbi:MAG: efflux RND transporter periplasmic adaptor subunit [Gammaproteobacteria bacterium]|nr:efflux RND transporter periplasmic adaptor subunit [Gammaproteobacteria bacterium]MDH3412387.1 efflux RND transporter periplasmic adaptor subunit [Gammaproteobacteria bacterium]
MKTGFRIVLLLLLAAGAVFGFLRYRSGDAVSVVLAPVERGRVEASVANTRAGTVMACRRSKIAPAIGGQVARLSVREGDHVSENQILMVIWNRDLEARLKLAASEELAAKARVQEVCLVADVADREARRQQKLSAQNLVSEEQVDRATTESKAKHAACEAANATVDVSRARVEAAQAALDQTILRAPFNGVVAEVNAELGEFVTPSPPGIPTLPAVDLIDTSCLYVSAPIDEVDAPQIRIGMPACVTLDAFPKPRCNAKVRRIAPYVLDREKQARTVEIEVELTDPIDREGLLPGYSADVEIVLERRESVLSIPTEAVLEGNQVLVYRSADGILELRTFKPGISNWRYTEIASGLDQGERVVVSVGREGVAAGARVTPEESSAGSAPSR